MTVKELAEVAGVSAQTIRRAAQEAGIAFQHGVTARFDHDQSMTIIRLTRPRRDRRITVEQGAPQQSQNGTELFQNGTLSVWPNVQALTEQNALLSRHLAEVVPAMMKMADACMTMARSMSERPTLPAPTPVLYKTISGYCREKRIQCDGEAAKRWGRMAKHLSDEHGYEIQSVPDARWGAVNAYHVNVLREVVGQ